MRILLVSFFFPPYNQIGAVRNSKFAKYLLRAGHDVRVLCAHEPPVPKNLGIEIDPARVTYSPWYNVNRVPELLLGGREKVAEQGYRRPGWRGRLLAALGQWYAAITNFPDRLIGWYWPGLRAGDRLLREWRPDIIVATTPITGLLVGSALARRHGLPWVADMRDLWTDNPVQISHAPLRRLLERWLERRTLGSAAGFVAIAPSSSEKLAQRYGKPVATILNGFDVEDMQRLGDIAPPPGLPLRLLFTGMVYPEHQRLDLLFAALRDMTLAAGQLSVDFYGRNLYPIQELIVKYRVAEIVKVHPPVSYDDSLRLQRAADALLFFTWANSSQTGILSGKIYEYLAARRPLLLIGPEIDDVTRMVTAREAGELHATPQATAARLAEWIGLKRSGKQLPATPASACAGIDRQSQALQLAEFLKDRIAPATPGR